MIYREFDMEFCEKIFEEYEERLKIHEAAKLLGFSVSKLRRLVREKKIPADKAGKWHIFHKQILIDYYLADKNELIREVNEIHERH